MSTDDITLRPAAASDRPAVAELLRAAELPLDGVPAGLEHFIVATRGGEVVGAIGLEVYGDAALLRSAVVHPNLRGVGLGERLVDAVLGEARAQRIQDVTLLTTTAMDWFPRFGFTRINRADVNPALLVSEELRGACPATAVVMRRAL